MICSCMGSISRSRRAGCTCYWTPVNSLAAQSELLLLSIESQLLPVPSFASHWWRVLLEAPARWCRRALIVVLSEDRPPHHLLTSLSIMDAVGTTAGGGHPADDPTGTGQERRGWGSLDGGESIEASYQCRCICHGKGGRGSQPRWARQGGVARMDGWGGKGRRAEGNRWIEEL
jgi:hypothetical protein